MILVGALGNHIRIFEVFYSDVVPEAFKPQLKSVLQNLAPLNDEYSRKQIITEHILEQLRRQLATIRDADHPEFKLSVELTFIGLTEKSISLQETAVSTLMSLTAIAPMNGRDPISLEDVYSSNRILVSTGHQFDVENFVKYNMTRPLDRKKDFIDGKLKLKNPLTRMYLHPLDNNFILEVLEHYHPDQAKQLASINQVQVTLRPRRANGNTFQICNTICWVLIVWLCKEMLEEAFRGAAQCKARFFAANSGPKVEENSISFSMLFIGLMLLGTYIYKSCINPPTCPSRRP